MKNWIGVLFVLLTLCLTGCGHTGINSYKKSNLQPGGCSSGSVFLKYQEQIKHSSPVEAIPDSKTASNVAEAILKQIYGDTLEDETPFKVTFDDKYQVWLVEGTLAENRVGGVAHIILQKKDGKVLAIWHDK
ncbi:MAG: NTF2 fold immunity protein [Chitinophagales bacterium]